MSDSAQDKKISERDILKVFDRTDDPFLTASEIAEELPVSRQAVNYRLQQMREKDLVGKKKTGARSVGWWAKATPRLADDIEERLEEENEDPLVAGRGLFASGEDDQVDVDEELYGDDAL